MFLYLSAHLYLLQEYFVCETLDSRLNMQNKDGKTVNPIDQDLAAKSILGILEGMEAIHSYGVSICSIYINLDGLCQLGDDTFSHIYRPCILQRCSVIYRTLISFRTDKGLNNILIAHGITSHDPQWQVRYATVSESSSSCIIRCT